jgi:hypothetical protein
MLKIAYIKRILFSCQQNVGVCFNNCWFRMIGVSMERIVTMFQTDREHSGSMFIESFKEFRSFLGESQFCYRL